MRLNFIKLTVNTQNKAANVASRTKSGVQEFEKQEKLISGHKSSYATAYGAKDHTPNQQNFSSISEINFSVAFYSFYQRNYSLIRNNS